MATTSKIIPKKITEELDPLQEYKMLKEQQAKLSEGILGKLERQLAEASETSKVLDEMGIDYRTAPQITQYLSTFQLPTQEKTRRVSTNERKPRVDLQIREWLLGHGEASLDEITSKFSDEDPEKIKQTMNKRASGDRPIFKQVGNKFLALAK